MKSRSCILVVVALLWTSVSFAAESPDVYARLEHAQAVSDAGDFDEAERLFDSVLRTMARDDHKALAWAYFGRSYAGHQLSETEDLDRERMNAIVDGYRQAWSLDRPVYLAAASFNAGLILHRLGNSHAALDAFLQATTITHPALGMAYFNAAREYEALGMPGEAAHAYQKAIDEEHDDDVARESLLELYSRQAWDKRLVDTARMWSAESRNLSFINHKLNELLQRKVPPARDTIADSALVLLANNHALMGLNPANFALSVQIEYDRAVAVHPRLRVPVRALNSAYQVREQGAPYSEPRESAWWRQTHERHQVWSTVLMSLGNRYWITGDLKTAASYYEAAVGYRAPYLVESWVNLDALGMLAASVYQATGETSRIAELIHGVDRWVAEGNLKTKEQRKAIRDFYYIAGWAYTQSVQYSRAIELYNKSLELDPDFADTHVNLGYIYMGSLNLTEAISNFERAVELDPTSSMANNNLGFVTLIHADFAKAIHYLERAHQLENFLLNIVNLGDAYRYAGNAARALELHLEARQGVRERSTNESYMGTGWRYNYMPLYQGDTDTIQESILVRSLNEKRAFVHYALSFDYALLRDIDTAQREFITATRYASSRDIRCFFANKIAAIQAFVNVTGPPARWLEEKRLELRNGSSCSGS